jgi:hypothetical protein
MDARKLLGLSLVALAMALPVGCGSTASSPQGQSSVSTAQPDAETPHIAQPGQANGQLDDVKSRIQAAGHGASFQEHTTIVVASLVVPMKSGGETFVSGYRSASDLARELQRIQRVSRRFPGRLAIRTVGTHLYWTGRERQLTPAERSEFAQIVASGEGKQ